MMPEKIKIFPNARGTILDAYAHAKAGGIALNIGWGGTPGTGPRRFRETNARGYLFDMDIERLTALAKRLGVKNIYIDREGQETQHVDICGKPLIKACEEAEREEFESDLDVIERRGDKPKKEKSLQPLPKHDDPIQDSIDIVKGEFLGFFGF